MDNLSNREITTLELIMKTAIELGLSSDSGSEANRHNREMVERATRLVYTASYQIERRRNFESNVLMPEVEIPEHIEEITRGRLRWMRRDLDDSIERP